MRKSLTQEQKQALDLTKHIALNANAGSGKTSVLVERYLKILEEFIKSSDDSLGPNNIVAITFTNKAASEMHSRVVFNFQEKYQSAMYSATESGSSLISSRRIREFRDKLTSARISTIHSFCLQLISRYPVESGIPVYFREISQAERLALIDQAFNAVIDEWLTSDNSDLKKILSEILVQIDIYDLKEVTILVLSNNQLIQYFSDFYQKGFEKSSKLMFDFLKNTFLSPGLNLFDLIIGICAKEENKGVNLPSQSEVEEIWTKIDNSSFELLSEQNFWEKISEHFFKVLTKDNKLRKKIKDNLSDKNSSVINDNLRYSKPFLDIVAKIISYNSFIEANFPDKTRFWLEEKYFDLCRDIFRFIVEVQEKFQFYKYDEGLLDFNDMLFFAYQLLKDHPEVLEEILKEIKFILVDEFQDTDELQYLIIKALVPNLNGSNSSLESPNLFVVGDSKQSIYSFRNADVRIFERIKKEIFKANQCIGHSDNNFGILNLSFTFRLHPEISAFVDAVFSELMRKNDYTPNADFFIPYEQFIIPKSKFTQYLENANREDNKSNPRVKFLLHIKSEDTIEENDDADDATEENPLAEKLVNHIQFIVGNEDYKIFDKETNSFRTITYSDIAIISRKIKDLASLVPILSEKRVPFIFQGIRNFFATTEISDFIAFLKFLINPNDDVALAGILRSIFFGFPNEWLVNIATITKKNLSFWDKMNLAIEKIQNDEIEFENDNENKDFVTYLIESRQILLKLLRSYASLPLNEIIQRIILETNWVGKVRSLQNYEQILANVDELLDYARDFIGLGFKTIYDFIEQIDYANKHGIAEGDRFGVVATNALRLLTIHSVKGLEFPVVYIYKIDSKSRKVQSIFLSKEFGIAFPMKIYSQEKKFSVKTLQFHIAKYHADAEMDAEEIRILYVALTRASEYLILTGTATEVEKQINDFTSTRSIKSNTINLDDFTQSYTKKTSNQLKFKGALDKILNALKFDESLFEQRKYPLLVEIMVGDEVTHDISRHTFRFYLDWVVGAFPLLNENTSPQSPAEVSIPKEFFLLGKIDFPINEVVFSPTKFLTYLQDRKLFLKRYFLGLSDELTRLEKAVMEEEIEWADHIIFSSIVGSVVHYCLQNLGLWNINGIIDYDKLSSLISSYFYMQERIKELEIRDIVVQQCLNVVQTPLFKGNFEAILSSPKEYEVLLPYADNFLFGKIDLLLTKPNGEQEIWDWKTNNISEKGKMIELASHYEFQMKTYAFLLSRCYPEQKQWVVRLLFTRLAKPNSSENDWTYVFRWDINDLNKFEELILQNLKKISNLNFE